MDRRRKINVNRYESLTDAELRSAVEESHGARVCPKMRVADALHIEHSGLSSEAYSYALKAHFDFVVADKSDAVLFAIEFDEPHHQSDSDAQRRDRLKEEICLRLGMPLLRISSEHLEPVGFPSPRSPRRSLLAGEFSSALVWAVECWFMGEAFDRAQARGEIPDDEPFIAQNILGYDATIHARVRGQVANLVGW